MINHGCDKLEKNHVRRIELKNLPESKQWSNLSMLIMFISLDKSMASINYGSNINSKREF